MPPTNQDLSEAQIVKKDKWYTPLCQVTTTSKILAAVLMIILPFVGFYFGYTIAKDKYFSEEDLAREWNLPQETEYSPEEQVLFDQMKRDFDNTLRLNKVKNGIDSTKNSDKASPAIYVVDRETSNQAIIKNEDFEYIYKTSYDVQMSDELATFAGSNFWTILASTSDRIILTRHCFKDTECSYHGLYSLDLDTKTLEKMKYSDIYDETWNGSVLSPAGTHVISLDTHEGAKLVSLNLLTGELTVLHENPDSSEFSFCPPAIGCELDISWLSDKYGLLTAYTLTEKYRATADDNFLATTTVEIKL